MDPRVSKTRGLVRVAELNGIKLQNICVFGDADNDTCMVADAARAWLWQTAATPPVPPPTL
mgnify:CR=1 FL=1